MTVWNRDRKKRFWLAVVTGLVALEQANVVAAQPSAKCQLIKVASLDMATDKFGGVSVVMNVNGKNESLLVDTGGITSMLTSRAADDLGLPRHSIDATKARFTLIGSEKIDHYVTAESIQLGNLVGQKKDFMILPDDRVTAGIDGTLAPDIMGAYDVELDFARHTLNLFSPDHCEGRVVYWTHQPYAVIPMGVDRWGKISFKVGLDGHPVIATMDTGSSRSLVRSDVIADFVSKDQLSAAEVDPIKSGNAVPPRIFKTMVFQDVGVLNPDLEIVSSNTGAPDMLLGMGVIRQLHLYISYKERNLYVTSADAH